MTLFSYMVCGLNNVKNVPLVVTRAFVNQLVNLILANSPIYDRIQENWFPGENPLNNSLLSHEWCKHGSCTNMTELAYFNMTLGLYDELVANDLLSLCNQRSKECYFIVNQNFTITNTTMDLSKKDRSNAHKECEDHSLLISSPAGCS